MFNLLLYGMAFMDRWQVSYDLTNNGEEAMNLVKNQEYELVLMDYPHASYGWISSHEEYPIND